MSALTMLLCYWALSATCVVLLVRGASPKNGGLKDRNTKPCLCTRSSRRRNKYANTRRRVFEMDAVARRTDLA